MRCGRGRFRAAGAMAFVLILTSKAVAQADTSWMRQYNGPGNGSDRAQAMRVDAAGNVYVTGNSWGIGSYDFATIKYDALGNPLWERRYNGPGNSTDSPNALAVDAQGNVYVTGLSYGNGTGLDYATLKYDSAGDLLWERRYDGPANRDDWPMALCVDEAGSVCVTGWSDGGATGHDFATLKYDSAGTLLWERRFNGPINRGDAANAIAVDSAGNVFVAGGVAVDSADDGEVMIFLMDFATLKYDPDGNLLWERRYDGPSHWVDIAFALQVDSIGNVYVAGNSYGALVDSGNWALLKYDPDGDLLWTARFNGPGQLYSGAGALALGPAGSVYAIGGSYGGTQTGRDFATLKFGPDGAMLWERTYSGPGNGYDDLVGVCVDAAGNAYVTGRSPGDHFHFDWATLMYDADGHLLWQERYNGPADGDDEPAAIALDPNGALLVSGYSTGPTTDRDYTTIKYAPCPCPCHGDPQCDSVRCNLMDVVMTVNVAFRGLIPSGPSATCPVSATDVNCSGLTDVSDVVLVVDVAFRNADPFTAFCAPCRPDRIMASRDTIWFWCYMSTATDTFTVWNAGQTSGAFTLSPAEDWPSLDITSGSLPPGGMVRVTVTVNCLQPPFMQGQTRIIVKTDGVVTDTIVAMRIDLP